MNPQPPKRALKFLQWFCRKEHIEEIEGNLIELYEIQSATSENKAKWAFYKNVLLHFRPEYIRSFHLLPQLNDVDMYKNYFKIALRNLTKNKTFSTINIAGLVLGMVCFLFIFLWVEDERSIDNFHKNGANLYNVYETISANGQVNGTYNTLHHYNEERGRFIPIANIKDAVPEVKRLNFYATGYELPWGHPETFQIGDRIHKLEGSRASADFFNLFDYPIIAGNQSTPLSDISSLAISRKMANLFFPTPADAIGKSIRYEDRLDFKITAVFEDVPYRSSLKFDFLINWKAQMTQLEWASNRMLTTIQLAEKTNVKQVEDKLNQFLQPHLDPASNTKMEVGLQPFKDQYLVANFVNGKPLGGRIEYVQIFSGVALFILLLACINFMNLSTARASKRAKEVGIRKVIGSTKSNLMGQFLGESILMSTIALLLAILLIKIFLPYFNNFTGKQILFPLSEPNYWAIAIGLMLITGIAAGSYPALFLSSLEPTKVLKGVFKSSRSSIWLRKGLTIFQFSLSIFLLIAAVVVSRQTNYIQHSHLGYDKENLLYVRVEGELSKQQKYNLFKNRALKMPGIAKVDRSSEAPHAMGFVIADPINWEGKPKDANVGFKPSSVGYDFVDLMNLEIKEGRDFSKNITTDSALAFLVNETAVNEMGIKDPIGKWVSAWNKKGKIVGILKDYHTHSLHEPIKPVIIDVKEYEYFGVILVRTKAGETQTALASLEKIYKEINPNYPFDYQFIDQEYQALYKSEQVVAKLSNIFALLAISVSCLGLLGLAIFSAGQRLKEISIRKVLGASVNQLIVLLSRDFLALIGWSFLVAAPISWLIMKDWLQSFAYQIDLSWWIFAFAGVTISGIAILIISTQSVKVAFSNPIDALKND